MKNINKDIYAKSGKYNRYCLVQQTYVDRKIERAHKARLETQNRATLREQDLNYLSKAAELSQQSVGLTQPHPNASCILVNEQQQTVAEAYQYAQGTVCPEIQVITSAREEARGCTAYLNLEPGNCPGDDSDIEALIKGQVKRVVVGLRHPLQHFRGRAIQKLRGAGVQVDLLGDTRAVSECEQLAEQVAARCRMANEALLHRAATNRPFSILKYAMTLDGKIACKSGHSAWISCPDSRKVVFKQRAASNAVIVGGETVRRDNPNLTTRQPSGHSPARVVMSRTLDLPAHANLWDISIAPTIVMTQYGARRDFQKQLRDRGVEVVEFDFLSPDAVSRYCYQRGWLQCLWECGGTLAAPAISQGAVHKAIVFIAPKIIGGREAPSPCDDLGFVEMTQALQLCDTEWSMIPPDIMLSGYLPSSSGLKQLDKVLSSSKKAHSTPVHHTPLTGSTSTITQSETPANPEVQFLKVWDSAGALSNFSQHPIVMPAGTAPLSSDEVDWVVALNSEAHSDGAHAYTDTSPSYSGSSPAESSSKGDSGSVVTWPSVEHYYQAQKFAGIDAASHVRQSIMNAPSPEHAADIGRSTARKQPELVRPNWDDVKSEVMFQALRAKFAGHQGPLNVLLKTKEGNRTLVEESPNDFYWGSGVDGTGRNELGRQLMRVREILWNEQANNGDLQGKAVVTGVEQVGAGVAAD